MKETELRKHTTYSEMSIKEFAAGVSMTDVFDAVATAYGYLWHVNNEPGTPYQYPPERAAYEARKVLRDLLTHEQRGHGINRVHKGIYDAPRAKCLTEDDHD